MSSTDDAALVDKLAEQCLGLLTQDRIEQHSSRELKEVTYDQLLRLSPAIQARIAELLPERSKGKFTVASVDLALVKNRLGKATYFVRVPTDLSVGELVRTSVSGMVLCEINPYRRLLIANVPFNTQAS